MLSLNLNYLFKLTLYSALLIEIALMLGCKPGRPEIKCKFNQATFVREIQNELSADSVIMESVVLKEEAYFPTLIAIHLVIDNPTTPIYDFKNYNSENPERFDDYEKVEIEFKELGKEYALRIVSDCDLNGFNDIMIDFGKTDKRGEFHRVFICHYSDLVNTNQ